MKWALETRPGTVLRILVTLFFVTLSMAFAQPSLHSALTVVKKMFVWQTGLGLPVDQNRLWWTVYLVVAAHLVVLLGVWKWVWRRVPGPVLGAACALLFVTAQVLSRLGLILFVTAVGGYLSPPRAALGAAAFGMAESLWAGYFPVEWRDAWMYLFLVAMLVLIGAGRDTSKIA